MHILDAQFLQTLSLIGEPMLSVGLAVGQSRRQKATTTPGGAISDKSLLDKNNICIGLTFFCLHCSPKARETTADNEQLTFFIRRYWRQRLRHDIGVVPKRAGYSVFQSFKVLLHRYFLMDG